MRKLEQWFIQRILIPLADRLHTAFGRSLDKTCDELAKAEQLDPRSNGLDTISPTIE